MSKNKKQPSDEERDARRAANRKYYRENKRLWLERYMENRDEILAQQKAYRKRNRQKYLQAQKRYNQTKRGRA